MSISAGTIGSQKLNRSVDQHRDERRGERDPHADERERQGDLDDPGASGR